MAKMQTNGTTITLTTTVAEYNYSKEDKWDSQVAYYVHQIAYFLPLLKQNIKQFRRALIARIAICVRMNNFIFLQLILSTPASKKKLSSQMQEEQSRF